MAGDLLSRYLWLFELLMTHERLTRQQINDYWLRSSQSDGNPLPERTFFHMRRAVEDKFGVKIACNNIDEYYLMQNDEKQSRLIKWLLDSYSVNQAIGGMHDETDRIIVEEVPSARKYLQQVLDAIRERRQVKFSYAGFSRSREEKGIIYSPYFVKLYRQRWYMIGRNEKKKAIRTYALDRITDFTITEKSFTMPDDVVPSTFFSNILGITTSRASVKRVELRVTPGQAKYFRALPLHETQKEETIGVGGYITFSYQLRLNYELVHEILSYGSQVEVLAPKELILMVKEELDKMNRFYDKTT